MAKAREFTLRQPTTQPLFKRGGTPKTASLRFAPASI